MNTKLRGDLIKGDVFDTLLVGAPLREEPPRPDPADDRLTYQQLMALLGATSEDDMIVARRCGLPSQAGYLRPIKRGIWFGEATPYWSRRQVAKWASDVIALAARFPNDVW